MTREELLARQNDLLLANDDDLDVMRFHLVTETLKVFLTEFTEMPAPLQTALKTLIKERDGREKHMSKISGILPAHLRPKEDPKPVTKRDTLRSLQMVDSNSGTTTGTVDVLRSFLNQIGLTDESMVKHRVIVNGDLGTLKNVLGAQDLVSGYFGGSIPPMPVRDLHCIILRQGFFHTGWNAMRGLSRVYWGERDSDTGSLRWFANLLFRFSKLKDAPIYDKFKHLLTDIQSGAMCASLLAEFR